MMRDPAAVKISTAVQISTKEAARLLGCSPRTLEAHRRNRVGLQFFQPLARDGTPIGRPWYLLSDVLEAADRGRVKTFPRHSYAKRTKPARLDTPLNDDLVIETENEKF